MTLEREPKLKWKLLRDTTPAKCEREREGKSESEREAHWGCHSRAEC